MFKNKLFGIFIFFIFWANAFAQTIEFGQPVKIKNRSSYFKILGYNESGTFIAKSSNGSFKKNVVIEKFNAKLNFEFSTEIQIGIPSLVEQIVVTSSGINLFITAKNNITNKVDFLMQKLDSKLNPVGGFILMASFDEALIDDRTDFSLIQSINKKYYCLSLITRSAENKKEKSTLHTFGFNDSLNLLYNKNIEIDHEINDVEITKSDVDNEGNFFCLLDYPEFKNKKKSRRSFVMYSFHRENQFLKLFDIGKFSFETDEIGFSINNKKKRVDIIGFYTDIDEDKVKGYYTQNIDIPAMNLETNIIDTSLIKMISQSLSINRNFDLNDLYIKKIIPKSDGGVFLIAEKFLVSKQSYTYYVNGFPQTNTRSVFNYNDVVFLNLNQNGFIENYSIVNKEQQSVSDGGYFSSISNFVSNDAVYIIYNADVSKEGDVLLSKFDVNGKVENKILVKAINSSVLIIPSDSKQVSAKSFLASTVRNNRFSLMRVTF